ncbi:MAG: amidohydrolase family protein [Thermoplasmataceae archaeon]
MKSKLILNAIIVSQDSNRSVFKGNILIEGNRIVYAGPEEMGADEIVDGRGKIAMPGMINTHCHVAMTHLRGQIDDVPLSSFLEKTFKLDAERTEKGIYNSSILGIREMVHSGITSFLDLYYSEDIIARAVEKTGIRGFLAWNTLDEDKTTQKGNPVKNADRFISEFKGGDLVTPAIGVQGIYVAGDETYLSARDVADRADTIIHGHLAETREEVYNYVRVSGGERPIEHLSKIGFLNQRFIAAHSVWATLHEVRLLSKASSSVSWNPVSNAKLGVGGIAPIPEYLNNGVTVTIGSDSTASNNSQDIISSMKFGSIWVKNDRWNPASTNAQMLLDMATVNAAAALKRKDIGSIAPGMLADIVLIDAANPRMVPTTQHNAVSNIVYSADTSCISDVMVNGEFLKRGGSLLLPQNEDLQPSDYN